MAFDHNRKTALISLDLRPDSPKKNISEDYAKTSKGNFDFGAGPSIIIFVVSWVFGPSSYCMYMCVCVSVACESRSFFYLLVHSGSGKQVVKQQAASTCFHVDFE